MMSQYVTKGLLIPGSIIDRLVKSGVSPIQLMYNKPEHCNHIGNMSTLLSRGQMSIY